MLVADGAVGRMAVAVGAPVRAAVGVGCGSARRPWPNSADGVSGRHRRRGRRGGVARGRGGGRASPTWVLRWAGSRAAARGSAVRGAARRRGPARRVPARAGVGRRGCGGGVGDGPAAVRARRAVGRSGDARRGRGLIGVTAAAVPPGSWPRQATILAGERSARPGEALHGGRAGARSGPRSWPAVLGRGGRGEARPAGSLPRPWRRLRLPPPRRRAGRCENPVDTPHASAPRCRQHHSNEVSADGPRLEHRRNEGTHVGSFKVKLVVYFLLLSLLPIAAAFWGFTSVAGQSETRRVDARLQSGLRASLAAYQERLDAAQREATARPRAGPSSGRSSARPAGARERCCATARTSRYARDGFTSASRRRFAATRQVDVVTSKRSRGNVTVVRAVRRDARRGAPRTPGSRRATRSSSCGAITSSRRRRRSTGRSLSAPARRGASRVGGDALPHARRAGRLGRPASASPC